MNAQPMNAQPVPAQPTPLGAGEPCPFFRGRTGANDRFNVDTLAGRHLLIAFIPSSEHPLGAAFLAAMASLADRFDDTNLTFMCVTLDPSDEGRLKDRVPGIRYMFDGDRNVSRTFGLIRLDAASGRNGFRPSLYLVDPRYRITDVIPLGDPAASVALLARLLDSLPPIAGERPAVPQAPVLTVPGVFEPELCRRLITAFEREGGSASGFMTERDGLTVGVMNSERKRRYDFMVEDEGLRAAIRERLARRLTPELMKAYQFQGTRLERYLVACYDSADRGYFRAHRDNTTKGTAHRQFAVTINLNDGYEGGRLVFPEFGHALHGAPPGAAIVFSCSLLHEARPVTAGKRYAFLTFLYDNAMARLRQENSRFVASETPQPAPVPEAAGAV
ncbi:2OG-Fe(II) oxygenase [Azospirillum sp. SYSU D00513]|uniref:2OG-Fe(II) oxygenase family protein n=1 Tax=Azospirillum sp. SYSU D00513 TaxID=2812561 RepID=UPI001A9746FD|nr:2OG-Fe(II) oxygenase [Azospirillum sp. SYSU D00513]